MGKYNDKKIQRIIRNIGEKQGTNMKTINIDLTSFQETLRSCIECFDIEEREYLMHDYFIGRDRGDLSVSDFISHIGCTSAPILHNPLQLCSLHVTTNDDHCSTIRVSGIMDLQAVVTEATPLREFFMARGIRFDVSKGEINANGAVYRLNRNASGASATDDDALLEYVSWKLYTDFPICGFLCTPNALAYGGNVNRRPEFLNNISKLLNRPDLVREWEADTQAYIVKFGLPLGKYEAPNDRERVGSILLQAAYDYIFNGGPVCDVYSFLPPHIRVEPNEILTIYTAEEYREYIS
ncbi:hypothetical protein V4D07_25835 [Paenibacillus taichungensis]